MNAEDEAIAAAAAGRAKKSAGPGAKKAKTAAKPSAAKKRKGKDTTDEDDEDEDEDDDSSDDDGAGASGSGTVAARGGDLRAAARATARELVVRKQRSVEAHAQLEARLALAALEINCVRVMSPQFYQTTEPYKALLAELTAPLPAAALAFSWDAPPGGGGAAAPSLASLGATAAVAILSGVMERAGRVDAALDDELNELVNAWTMSPARMAHLLGCSSGGTVNFMKAMRIDDKLCAPVLRWHARMQATCPAHNDEVCAVPHAQAPRGVCPGRPSRRAEPKRHADTLSGRRHRPDGAPPALQAAQRR